MSTTNQLQGDTLQDAAATTPLNYAQEQAKDVATTPAGTAAAGGTPDEAKMTGTPAQKLSRQQRITKDPSETAKAAGELATQRADRMRQVGGLGTRLDAKIQSYINQQFATQGEEGYDLTGGGVAAVVDSDTLVASMVSPTAPAVDAEGNPIVDSSGVVFSGTKQEFVEHELNKFIADPTTDLAAVAQKIAEVDPDLAAAIMEPGGLTAIIPEADRLIQEATQGQLTKTPEQMTLGEVELFEAGEAAEIADMLGIDEATLRGMTFEQLQGELDRIESKEFSEVDSLRAEMATASPQRRQQIQQRLQEMGASGEYTADQQFEDVERALDEGETLEFGGEEFTLEELLSDDGVSSIVQRALGDEDYLAELAEIEPGLHAWITTNRLMLEETQGLVSQAETEATATQQAFRDMNTKLGPLADVILGDTEGIVTEAQMEEFNADMATELTYKDAEGNTVTVTKGEFLTGLIEDPDMKAQLEKNPWLTDLLFTIGDDGTLTKADGLIEYLSDADMKEDFGGFLPEDEAAKKSFVEALKGHSKTDIQEAIEASNALRDADGMIYKGIWGDLGMIDEDGFVSDPAVADKILMANEYLEKIDSKGAIGDDTETFQAMLEGGAFDIDDLEQISKYPGKFADMKEAWIASQVDTGDRKELLGYVFGDAFGNASSFADFIRGKGPNGSILTPEAKEQRKQILQYLSSDNVNPDFHKQLEKHKDNPKKTQKVIFDALAKLVSNSANVTRVLNADKNRINFGADKLKGLFDKVQISDLYMERAPTADEVPEQTTEEVDPIDQARTEGQKYRDGITRLETWIAESRAEITRIYNKTPSGNLSGKDAARVAELKKKQDAWKIDLKAHEESLNHWAVQYKDLTGTDLMV